MWQELCPSLPQPTKLTTKRKQTIRSRLAEMGKTEQAWTTLRTVMTKIEASNFLRGDNKSGWRANFDWLFANSTNWVKIIECNYDNSKTTHSYANNHKSTPAKPTAEDYLSGF